MCPNQGGRGEAGLKPLLASMCFHTELGEAPFNLISVPNTMGRAHIQVSNNSLSQSFNPWLLTLVPKGLQCSIAVESKRLTVILNDCLYPVYKGKMLMDHIFSIQIFSPVIFYKSLSPDTTFLLKVASRSEKKMKLQIPMKRKSQNQSFALG